MINHNYLMVEHEMPRLNHEARSCRSSSVASTGCRSNSRPRHGGGSMYRAAAVTTFDHESMCLFASATQRGVLRGVLSFAPFFAIGFFGQTESDSFRNF